MPRSGQQDIGHAQRQSHTLHMNLPNKPDSSNHLNIGEASIPDLGLKQVRSGLNRQNYVWSVKLQYSRPISELFNDTQLYGLAKQAWHEMEKKYNELPSNRRPRKPLMMGLISVNQSIYFSSSMKGESSVYEHGKRVEPKIIMELNNYVKHMKQHKLTPVSEYHGKRGSCAEIMALHNYYTDASVSDDDKHTLPRGMRSAAYGKKFKPKGYLRMLTPIAVYTA
ncbi:hypothetical protein BS50DRAFT_593130 [Corynespora cassiicola Philippines]|uniref:Uncharacterized protein n=1 Tax=Corynespora cassiicola Philippines TaxID=1448308 RepID=A0A2T2N727_CORCC|nr:hypothetical protein BS50DRAFT_593130 [Corynespora cassiicola Philippines]